MIPSQTLRSSVLNVVKWLARHRLWGAALLCALAVAGCGPAPLGVGWPAVSMVTSKCENKTSKDVLVAYNDRIVLVNPANGKPVSLLNAQCEPRLDDQGKPRVWDFRGENANVQFYSIPVEINDNTLLAVAYNQNIYQIDLAAARSDATHTIDGYTGHTVADPLVTDDAIYVGLGAKDLVALNRQDLSVKWSFQTEHGVWAKPLLVDNVLYFTSLDHNLYAVDAATGQKKWNLDVEGAATATPVYNDGKLYIGSFGRKVLEVSATDGKVLNQYATEDWVWATPALQDGMLYVGDLAGNMYALDTTKGLAEVWKQKVAAGSIPMTPLVTSDRLIVGARDQKLYWLNRADGTVVKDEEGNLLVRELQAPILSNLLLVQPNDISADSDVKINEPYVIVSTTTNSEALVAYSLSKGQPMWTYAFQ